MSESSSGMTFFERYLSLWVLLCIVIGVLIGIYLPAIPDALGRLEYANVSLPIAVLIWLMIYPMMMKVDFSAIASHLKVPKGLTVTLVSNWIIKPFSMFAIAWLFFHVIYSPLIDASRAREYLAGAVLLGAAPCTAMVFVWSHLTRGNPAFTVLQVAVNDLVILVAFAPIVALLLGVSDIAIPMDTLLLSVVLFVVIPLGFGAVTRRAVIRRRGADFFNRVFVKRFSGITTAGLLLTLVIIFSFQGRIIIENPADIVLIAVPLIIQTILIFTIAYLWSWAWKMNHDVAAPAALIGASNFFELAVAVAIALFGLESGATLVTVVGVLVEVPVMLFLVKIANSTRGRFAGRTEKEIA
jgi:ACR3 family arsenite transporter